MGSVTIATVARCACLVALGCTLLMRPADVRAQDAPAYLPDDDAHPTMDALEGPRAPLTSGDDYTDLLAAGYLLALPAAAMTGGVGLLLPVGMHYYAGNPTGGNRAFLGIVGGITLGGTAGYFLDRPEGGFRFTANMAYGAVAGFFTWGVIDVLFFGETERPRSSRDMSLSLQLSPDTAGLGIAGRL